VDGAREQSSQARLIYGRLIELTLKVLEGFDAQNDLPLIIKHGMSLGASAVQ
jgi:hypothetical protein